MNSNQNKKLTKSRDDRVVAGVIGGIAEYFGWSSTALRAVCVLSGVGIGIYIVLMIIMPEPEPDSFAGLDMDDWNK